MIYDLQKASILKRISAGLLDFILTLVIATGLFFLLSSIFNYDSLVDELDDHYERYEEIYGIDFKELTLEQVENFTEEELSKYKEAELKFSKDEAVITTLSKIINTTLLMLTLGIFIALLITEFLIPVILKNGQTIGKKMFGICLMMDNGVKVKTLPLFVRTILGKFTIETMFLVYTLILLYFGQVNLIILFITAAILIANILMIIISPKNTLIHDAMSYIVVVDKTTQMIFNTEEELIKYKNDLAEKNARSKKTF